MTTLTEKKDRVQAQIDDYERGIEAEANSQNPRYGVINYMMVQLDRLEQWMRLYDRRN